MDIDQPEDGTQQAASAKDYEIKIDFEEELDEDEREVIAQCCVKDTAAKVGFRMARRDLIASFKTLYKAS